jgi:protein-L-isoaspartate(D-aspartate) O-methyltransferase
LPLYNTQEAQGEVVTVHNFEAMRQAMVASQLRTTAVSDRRVLNAMKTVPREAFLPEDRRAIAYADVSVPLGGGRALSSPMAIGRLLTEAGVREDDHVLLVGAATGYTAVLLARLAASVVAVEEDAPLAELATQALAGLPRVELVTGPLRCGWAGSAPYDLIVIDGAVEIIPDELTAQLADGGRIATGLLENTVSRLCIGRKAGGSVGFARFADAEIPALPGFETARSFIF